MRTIRQRTQAITVVTRSPHPLSVMMATALGSLYGRGINGRTGTLIYGTPGEDTNRSAYKGYAAPAQMFVGWNPRRAAGGAVLAGSGSLPSTSPVDPSDNPLQNAVAALSGAYDD